MNFPEAGSVWMYKNDPSRLYRVISMANVASRHEKHPPQVIYQTLRKPDNWWARTVEDFYRVMTEQERQA